MSVKINSNIKDDVINWRRDLHQIPEVGNDLPKTSAYVKKALDEMGVKYQAGVGIEHAIVAEIVGTGEGNGKCIALRGDMDGLPVIEDTGLEFASKNGCMHACGHDAHTAMLLGAVKAINEVKDSFKGTVKFLFQPGEETCTGAKPMVEAGCLKNPDVDYVLGLHVGNIGNSKNIGDIIFAKGSMMSCLDRFKITVSGKGSHGAYPHDSIDAIVIASHVVIGLQEIISREINPVEPGVVSIGMFHGGTAYNVITDKVEIEGTLRAVNEETREMISRRIGEIAQDIAKAYRGKAEFEYIAGAPPLVNDSEVTERIFKVAQETFGEDKVLYMDKPVMGGEDFAYYLKEVPGTFMFMANPLPIDGITYPHHNPKFAIDDTILDRGVQLFLDATLDLLTK